MKPMTNNTVLITGGTGGIGKAAAIGLATMGARVGITGRDRGRAEQAASNNYSGSRAYNQSKLANVMFTYELARRLRGTGVTANVMHPGMTNTSFSAEDPAPRMASIVAVLRPFMKSPQRGAETAVHLASSAEVKDVSGLYFANRKAKDSNKSSYDPATTARPWKVSADLVGLPVDAHR